MALKLGERVKGNVLTVHPQDDAPGSGTCEVSLEDGTKAVLNYEDLVWLDREFPGPERTGLLKSLAESLVGKEIWVVVLKSRNGHVIVGKKQLFFPAKDKCRTHDCPMGERFHIQCDVRYPRSGCRSLVDHGTAAQRTGDILSGFCQGHLIEERVRYQGRAEAVGWPGAEGKGGSQSDNACSNDWSSVLGSP
jgi:hypothetical protein